MDFSSILQQLQQLLTNKQGMQSSEFGSNLGLQQSELGQQNSQFQSQLALEKQKQDQANALAAQNLNFNQAQTTKETSLPFMQLMASLGSMNSPASQSFIQNLMAGRNPAKISQITPDLSTANRLIG